MSRALSTCLLPVLIAFSVCVCGGESLGGPTHPAQDQQKDAGAAPQAAAAPVKDAVASMREFVASKAIDKAKPGWKTALPLPPKLEFDATKLYFWQLQTSEGPIKIRLLSEVAPMHVSSTIFLTEIGFYDGLKFHRVIPDFMAQGGCPLGTGTGSPGYQYAGEFSAKVRHDKPGLLSMANRGPGTDGSQFFLTFVPTPHLDDKHTIFGEVVEGLENVKKLESFGSPSGKTSKPLMIDTAKIVVEAKP